MIQNILKDENFKCSECNEIHDETFLVCNCDQDNTAVYIKAVRDRYLVLICPTCDREIIRFPFTKKKESK